MLQVFSILVENYQWIYVQKPETFFRQDWKDAKYKFMKIVYTRYFADQRYEVFCSLLTSSLYILEENDIF